jgi:hypothetical protein
MRNIFVSIMFLSSIYQYSFAYELEQNSYIMFVAYRTLCLIIHTTFMIRIRAKLRWRFIVLSGVPKSYAYRSVGSESRGDFGSFFVYRRGARVHGNMRIHFVIHSWGVGGRWWQPCPSSVIPHVRVWCRSLNCLMRLLADQYFEVSRPILCSVLTLNHEFVWSHAILCIAVLGYACSC